MNFKLNQIDSTINELKNQRLESNFIWLRDTITESGRFSNLDVAKLYENSLPQKNQILNPITKQIDQNSVYKHFNQMYKVGKYDEILNEFKSLFAQNGTFNQYQNWNTQPIPKLTLSILTKSIIKTVH